MRTLNTKKVSRIGGKSKRIGLLIAFASVIAISVSAGAMLGLGKTGTIEPRVLSWKVQSPDAGLDTLGMASLLTGPHLGLKLRLFQRANFLNLRPQLLMDLAERESQWDTTAINWDDGAPGSHSYGLLQVKLSTARWILREPQMTAKNLLHVDTNIEAGTLFLKYCLDLSGGNESLAIAAYRRGPTAVRRMLAELASR